MNRRSMLGLLVGAVQVHTVQTQLNDQAITEGTFANLEKMLSTSPQQYDASMDEITARFAWLFRGKALPHEARSRTILRANNPRPDYIGRVWGLREDVGPTKRNLCIAIIALDDELRAKQYEHFDGIHESRDVGGPK